MISYVDYDSLNFINTLNTDPNGVKLTQSQRYGIFSLVNGLKNIGIWDKMKAVYPFIGGNAYKHKYNLKDPRDVNQAYRLTFSGTVTHTSNGIKGNSSNAYSVTYLPQNFNGDYLISMGYYSYENINAVINNYTVEMGVRAGITNLQEASLSIRHDNTSPTNVSGLTSGSLGGTVLPFGQSVVSNTIGLFSVSRLTTSDIKIYKGGEIVASSTATETATTIPGVFYIGGLNQASGSPNYFSARGCSFAYISKALTELEVAELSNIVENYQSILSRNQLRS